MGFCDPAPDEAKHLRLHLLWHGRPYTASIADKVLDACKLMRAPKRVLLQCMALMEPWYAHVQPTVHLQERRVTIALV